jgi:dUTP pyrophosphatase
MQVQVINKSRNELPKYETDGSAGLDVRYSEIYDIEIPPGSSAMVSTGLFVAIPYGYEIQVRPRSGLAAKYGVTVLNSPGTIDADYRGEIKVILINHGRDIFTIKTGDRIGQLVLNKVEQIEWRQVSELDTTDRGAGGFGSTGK